MRSVLLWGPVAVYMAMLFWLSSQPVLPGASLTPDWTQHGLAYAGLALVTLRAIARGRWSGVRAGAIAATWIVVTLYGVSDEFHQSFVPERTADVRDIVADGAGAALALAGVWAWGIIRRSP